MALQEKLYTVEDVWRLSQLPENELKHYYLIDGELFWDMPPGYAHGRIAVLIVSYLLNYAEEHDLGEGTVETGYYPIDDRHTLLAPDVAFIRKEYVPPADHEKFVPRMPDLAVEIQSPSNTVAELRRKAVVYLANGTAIVWLVLPARQGVEVWRAGADGEPQSEFVSRDGSLSGEQILPGFALELQRLFPR
ncbi:MAG: Uma2 family endonuclease [Chloroflexi bacterium]|nr:Uma2 family endonuclease [Chloroflexota bacterium]